MILKCSKTQKLFFSQAEATKHAEAIGAANFDEVAPETKLFVDAETKRRAFWTQDELSRFKQRTRQPEFQSVEITVSEYKEILESHEKNFLNDAKVINYAKKKIMDALCEVRAVPVVRAEKACWYTQNAGVEEAEAWLEAHKNDADIDKPLRLPPESSSLSGGAEGAAGNADGNSVPMEVDQEGNPVIKNGEGSDNANLVTINGESSPNNASGKNTDATATSNAQFVKERLNAPLLQELLSMGFNEIASEKALYFTNNLTAEAAVHWLTDHAEEEDINHPLISDPNVKPKLTKEEAQKAAVELQQRLKREREAREKQEAKDREKARIESTKMAQETNALLEEENRKRDIEKRKREEQQHAEHAAQLKEQLRLDYIERFGKEPPKEEVKDDIKSKPAKQQVLFWINELKKKHELNEDGSSNLEKVKVCMTTLKLYLSNAKNNPDTPKFHVVKKSNKAFVERVSGFGPEAFELLRVCGFRDEVDAEVFAIEGQVNGWLIGECIKFLDLMLGKM